MSVEIVLTPTWLSYLGRAFYGHLIVAYAITVLLSTIRVHGWLRDRYPIIKQDGFLELILCPFASLLVGALLPPGTIFALVVLVHAVAIMALVGLAATALVLGVSFIVFLIYMPIYFLAYYLLMDGKTFCGVNLRCLRRFEFFDKLAIAVELYELKMMELEEEAAVLVKEEEEESSQSDSATDRDWMSSDEEHSDRAPPAYESEDEDGWERLTDEDSSVVGSGPETY